MLLHTLTHVHSFNVIVSYLGLGQPPLQPRLITFYYLVYLHICNELGGETGVGCIPTRPASVDQVHTKNNKHTPVMVYDDLMIRNNTVLSYNINRS